MTDLELWLEQAGLAKYTPTFADHEISLADLPDLTDADLREMGLPIGPRKQFARAVVRQKSSNATPGSSLSDSTRGSSQGERRQLTVMFADLADSTALSNTLDMEDLRSVNLEFQELASTAVSQFEGAVARYMGDGVMAYFGYPRAHEDDSERAVRAGLQLVGSLRHFAHAHLLPDGTPPKVRIGIATGPVVVGDLIGRGASQEWAVVGSTPNLAARLESFAPLNAVVVAPTT